MSTLEPSKSEPSAATNSDAKIGHRKQDHVEITLKDDVSYRTTSGFEFYRLKHNALPEVNWDEVDSSQTFLGRRFPFPLFISSMTGGYAEGNRLNERIAEFCQLNDLPFGVGSQRVMLEDPSQVAAFSEIRKKAPDAFICGNIGGVQLPGRSEKEICEKLIDPLQANALIVHLNPLQEMLQREGDRNFKGILDGISSLAKASPVPIIVKETGAGIDGKTAQRLLEAGVVAIDVAGAGGTSWAKVEMERTRQLENYALKGQSELLAEWGVPTAKCLEEVSPLTRHYNAGLIASGGIRTPKEMLISLCLGADLFAMAQPILSILVSEGEEGLQAQYDSWRNEFRTSLLLLGCRNASELTKEHLYTL